MAHEMREIISFSYEHVSSDMLDLDEVVYELKIRGIEGITSTAEMRRALRNVLTSENDLAASIIVDAVSRFNPDIEHQVCSDKLDTLRQDLEDSVRDEHTKRRTVSRLTCLGLRVERNSARDNEGSGRFDRIRESIRNLIHETLATAESLESLDFQTVRRTDQQSLQEPLPIGDATPENDEENQRGNISVRAPEKTWQVRSRTVPAHDNKSVRQEGPDRAQEHSQHNRYSSVPFDVAKKKIPVSKWSITKFDGSGEELPRFLSSVTQYAIAEETSKSEVFRNRVHLFTGDAADFIRDASYSETWDELVDELTEYCLGTTLDTDLLRKIERKRQGPESCSVFCTRMELSFKTLRTPLPEQARVKIILRGMKSPVKKALAGLGLFSVREVRSAAQEVEQVLSSSGIDNDSEVEDGVACDRRHANDPLKH